MFDKGKNKYSSDIELGEEYRDSQTGITGVATAVSFFQHACERVQLELVDKDGALKEYVFDAPRLETVDTGERAGASRPGGPGSSVTGNASLQATGPR